MRSNSVDKKDEYFSTAIMSLIVSSPLLKFVKLGLYFFEYSTCSFIIYVC